MLIEDEHELLDVIRKAVPFEDYEQEIVNKAAECITLFPNSLKRVINVLKILKFL